MRKIVVTEFVSADGVMENPSWTMPYWNDEIAKVKGDEMFASDALLLGRVTYEGFAAAWPTSKDEGANQMNSIAKYVVSTTLQKAEWNNSHIIKGNVAEEIAKLKQQPGKDILVGGSSTLVNSLIQHNLVDEFTLLVYPLVLGSGKRLFKEGSHTTLKLVEAKALSKGVTLLRYQTVKQVSK